MKIFETKQSRKEYFDAQIERARRKFKYCKVSFSCVLRWHEIIKKAQADSPIYGPILCLGVRNGREVDIFRTVFFGSKFKRWAIKWLERHKYRFTSFCKFFESFKKSSIKNINKKSVVGVEINPDTKREDVFIGSFDELPLEWEGKFRIVFSNSFDQSMNPHNTAKEWNRVLAPGGYFIISYAGENVKPTLTDPVGEISLEDIRDFFPGDLIYYNKFGNNYRDVIIRKQS